MKLITVKAVIGKVLRDLNLKDSSRFDAMVEWSYEAMQYIGSYKQDLEQVIDLEVKNYKTELPCDFHKMIMVIYRGHGLRYEQNMPYHDAYLEEKTAHFGPATATYDIRYPYIHTSFSEGIITLQYLALPVDEDGLPLIPDNEAVKTALFWYIVSRLILGGVELPFKYDYAFGQWERFKGIARGALNMPSLAEMENIKNRTQRLLPLHNAYSKAFKDNTRERLLLKGRKYGR